MFKLMILCSLKDIYKREIWWDNDSIGRIEEKIYPIDGFRPRQKEKGEIFIMSSSDKNKEVRRYWLQGWEKKFNKLIKLRDRKSVV